MSAGRALGAFVPVLFMLILLAAAVGLPWMLRRGRRRPSVPAHVVEMAAWRRLSTEEQAAADDAVLPGPANLRETPEEAARRSTDRVCRDAEESARYTASRMAEAAQRNALFHP